MNILNPYKKSSVFLWINIIGLSIGLAASILLILLIVSEFSYDKHFKNADRIVRVYTSTTDEEGNTRNYAICRRSAYQEVPEKVAGIKSAAQVYNIGRNDFIYESEKFQGMKTFMVDKEFLDIFQLKYIDGTPESALSDLNSFVLTESSAKAFFGSSQDVIGKNLSLMEMEGYVSAVVEDLPYNTHFSFDVLVNIKVMSDWINNAGLEFHTFYLLENDSNVEEVRKNIEKEYTSSLKPFSERLSREFVGKTDLLSDIYLKSSDVSTLEKQSNMSFVRILSILALLILFLAITNFINLFMAQGEHRMREIGVRKTNGAHALDIIKQFFSEVSILIAVAFIVGLVLAIYTVPYFADMVRRDIRLDQLIGPTFVIGAIILFIITVVLSAFYPSFYLSRFNPLAILTNKVSFSKNTLNVIVVIFQSVITIILIAFLIIIDRQTGHLQNLPLGYEPEDVLCVSYGNASYDVISQELLTVPEIKAVSGGHHFIGGGASGQAVKLSNSDEKNNLINEYRIMPGLCELMGFRLEEGDFFKTTTPDSIYEVILNEAAVKMLDLKSPVTEKTVFLNGVERQVTGVIKDFYYDNPVNKIEPLLLTKINNANVVYIKFNDNINNITAKQKVQDAFHKIDPQYILDSRWSSEIYEQKFTELKTYSKVVMTFSFLSVVIAMMGILGIHLNSTVRRTKEVGIRRIHGATSLMIFNILTTSIVKWIVLAGLFAAPVIYFVTNNVLKNYENHVSFDWTMIVIPILVQCAIAIIVTSSITLKALSRNPVDVLKHN
jgi:ABC-type antimicrobial peptide transport system, permease component